MQAIQFEENNKIIRKKSLDCSCEKINLSKSGKIKFCNFCEICSEKKFLRQVSKPNCGLSDPFQI